MVWKDSGRVATYYVEYAVPPRATQVYYDRANTVFTNLKPDEIDWDYLLDTRLLHLSGLTVPLSPTIREILLEAVRRAKAAGVPVSFDMNYRRRVWSPEEACETVLPILRDVAVLFCGRSDARQVFGIEGKPEEIVLRLADITSAGHIVTSLSGDGLIGWDRRTFYRQPAREVTILDRIGAGRCDGWGRAARLAAGRFRQGNPVRRADGGAGAEPVRRPGDHDAGGAGGAAGEQLARYRTLAQT